MHHLRKQQVKNSNVYDLNLHIKCLGVVSKTRRSRYLSDLSRSRTESKSFLRSISDNTVRPELFISKATKASGVDTEVSS